MIAIRLGSLALLIAGMTLPAPAVPVVSELDWMEACGGATIEVVSDQKKLLGIRANALGSRQVVEWTVHFSDGSPVSAEYRQWAREKIMEGERAGENTGKLILKGIQSWRWTGDRIPIEDEARRAELAEILAKAKSHVEQGANGENESGKSGEPLEQTKSKP